MRTSRGWEGLLRKILLWGAGGDGAPDLTETLQNFVINSAAFALLSFLFVRDIQSQDRDQRTIQREEMLGRLQVTWLPTCRGRLGAMHALSNRGAAWCPNSVLCLYLTPVSSLG
jgi:hypothetical protein